MVDEVDVLAGVKDDFFDEDHESQVAFSKSKLHALLATFQEHEYLLPLLVKLFPLQLV